MPNSRHRGAICSPSSSRAMNFSRSSIGLHTFQGILRSPQKAQLCNPCLRNELSPLSQEGQFLLLSFLALQLFLLPRMLASEAIWKRLSSKSDLKRIEAVSQGVPISRVAR